MAGLNPIEVFIDVAGTANADNCHDDKGNLCKYYFEDESSTICLVRYYKWLAERIAMGEFDLADDETHDKRLKQAAAMIVSSSLIGLKGDAQPWNDMSCKQGYNPAQSPAVAIQIARMRAITRK